MATTILVAVILSSITGWHILICLIIGCVVAYPVGMAVMKWGKRKWGTN